MPQGDGSCLTTHRARNATILITDRGHPSISQRKAPLGIVKSSGVPRRPHSDDVRVRVWVISRGMNSRIAGTSQPNVYKKRHGPRKVWGSQRLPHITVCEVPSRSIPVGWVSPTMHAEAGPGRFHPPYEWGPGRSSSGDRGD